MRRRLILVTPAMVASGMDDATNSAAYQQALAFLFGRIDYERTPLLAYSARSFKLARMRELVQRLGDPDAKLPIVHIAGTKGKGSTAALMAAIAVAAGYRTGVFSSPHLDRIEERLSIDGQPASPDELVELVEQVRGVVEAMDAAADESGGPTYFEITTAMALCHFARRGVDLALLEVGLGGRLDSTNVCRPAVSVITSISYDHMAQLGNTLEAIAAEKAGIIKRGVPVVSGVTDDGPREVIERRCEELGSTLWQAGREFRHLYSPAIAVDQQAAAGRLDFELEPTSRRHEQLALGLLGRHQAANAAVALATIEVLRGRGWRFSDEAVARGLREARCPARIDVVARRPTIVVDAAHNVASVEALLATLEESFAARRRWLVFAAAADKDLAGMLQRLVPAFDRVLLARYQTNPRGAPVEELERLARECGPAEKSSCHGSIEAACQVALSEVGADDLLCATGSFFTAAEMRRQLVARETVAEAPTAGA